MCPKIRIQDNLNMMSSTTQEYLNAERWISSILQDIDDKWSDIQKVAYIDNAIGKKISYSPDFDTEVFNVGNARALWKIIDTGYGVCNGISQVEKYILDKIGVESEIVSGNGHAFLKIKNIELPCSDGTKKVGDTILDPTWNLMSQRYGAKPANFCKSYAEIRKYDIDDKGIDRMCHKNDEKLSSATLELDEQCLRNVYKSIGIADKEGNFPIQELFEKCKKIDECKYPEGEEIKRQFEALKEYYPDFATCQNSTMGILQAIVLNQENFRFNRCVVNRVYDKNDPNKSPVLYVFADLPDVGKKFYYVDSKLGEFIEIPQKEFEIKFECYEKDLEKYKGKRPWDMEIEKEKNENLEQSSGNIVAEDDGER